MLSLRPLSEADATIPSDVGTTALFYFVTGHSGIPSTESSLGTDSLGASRPNARPCL
jgi:hypothetical protein